MLFDMIHALVPASENLTAKAASSVKEASDGKLASYLALIGLFGGKAMLASKMRDKVVGSEERSSSGMTTVLWTFPNKIWEVSTLDVLCPPLCSKNLSAVGTWMVEGSSRSPGIWTSAHSRYGLGILAPY
jgi:hypothetical protein